MNIREQEAHARVFSKMNEIIVNAKKAGRALTAEEAAMVKEFQDMVSDDLRALPVNKPLTRPAPTGSGADSWRGSGGPFSSFGEMLRSVAAAGTPGGQVDSRLYEARAATGLGETVPSEGGFLVQSDYSNELLQAVYQTGILAQRCRRIQISGNSNSIKINAFDETSRASTRFGGVLSYFVDEAGKFTASKPAFRQMELSLKKMIGLCYASDEVLADSAVLENVIRQAFVSEFGFQMDNQILNGLGAGTPMGILHSGCLVTVSKQSGQAAATVCFENVCDMYARLLPSSDANSVWLVNRNVLPQLFQMSIALGTSGAPVWMPAGGISGQPYATLFGRPVIVCEQCASLGTVGDIILADLSNYVIAEKGGIESAMSIHVRFDYAESVFRFVMRWDGQPALSSALTPYKGSAALSPFVALETRS